MNKNIYFFLLLVAMSVLATGQTIILSDDFENYIAGQQLVAQSSEPFWTTWTNSPGSAEDPVVSNTQAYSGVNSVYIDNGNDLVLLFNDLTTGRYQLEFYIYIKTGFLGYFNLLQDFNGNNSEWGPQVFFNAGGNGSVDAGGQSTGSFTFTYDQWHYFNIIIDLDDDFSTIYFDNQEIISWQWSSGSFGTGTLNKLDAADFYGWDDDGNGTSGFYIDDIVFTQQIVPEAPFNLTANILANDIILNWNSPASSTPDNYSIMRNNEIIATDITDTFYIDQTPYPNTYTYKVRAHYNNLGYSHSSDTAMAIIQGGVTRQLVIFEIGTGTWCTYCPGAAMGADDLIANGKKVAIIEYHSGDSYENTDATVRINYYGISGFPTAVADGYLYYEGGSATESLYPVYEIMYNQRIDLPAIFTINLLLTQTGTYDYSATITTIQHKDYSLYFNGPIVLQTALTESHIPEIWQNQTEVNFVCRAMYPNAYGTSLNFSSSDTQTVNINFSLDPSFVKNNCEFVVFIQDNNSKEIIQTAKINMADVISVPNSYNTSSKIHIYPVPASNHITVTNAINCKYEIYDIYGKKIISGIINSSYKQINLSSLSNGIYLFKVSSDTKTFLQKIVITSY